MRGLKLESGDLVVADNDLELVDGPTELQQRIKLALSINRGEWFLDLNAGVPYIELMRQKGTQEQLKREVAKVIASFDEVEEITQLNMNYDGANRSLVVNFSAKLENGDEIEIEIEEVV
ncbi:hypothetical protein [Natroniella sp. ANB-PHB2]|uniref:hypothetical protein n=1 Tax=Natroniella sp. ANB-PHB2 TaxID=3384444 RepID=UPI0038D39FF0